MIYKHFFYYLIFEVEEPPGPGGPVDAVDDKPQENGDGENSHDNPTDNSIDAQDKSLDKQKDSLPDESQDGCSSNDSAENKKRNKLELFCKF